MEKYVGPLKGYHLAMQISGTLLCSTLGSLVAGIWLDKKLGTRPWLMLVLMVLGLGFAMFTIYRIANNPK